MLENRRVRTVSRRAHPGSSIGGCSCDLLHQLAKSPDVAAVFRSARVQVDALESARESLHASLDNEPADWRLRLQQRGGKATKGRELDQLLAILRCADTHAYRLLEKIGVDGHGLRKLLIERVREDSYAPSSLAATQTVDSTAARRSLRMSTQAPSTDVPSEPRAPRRQANKARDPSLTLTPVEPIPDQGPSLSAIDPEFLAPIHGRGAELATLADALLRHGNRAPLLVGALGSGCTIVAQHLSKLIRKPFFRLEAPRYSDEASLEEDLRAVEDVGGIVIFDDLDRVPGDTPPAFLDPLAKAWATGSPRVLTLVTHEGRCRLESWMPGVLDTLDVIKLDTLSLADSHSAIKLAAPAILDHHGAALAVGSHLSELTRLADRHLGGLAMPGRALDLLDLSCARSRRNGSDLVAHESWVEIVCDRTGLPKNHIAGTGDQDMLELDQRLARQVVGHEHVLDTLVRLIRRNRAGFASGRPIASVLLLGPSGVGKTEIAKALASALFERDDALVRLDMSEYAEAHAVARVVGAPPGYVGHEHGGALTDPLIQQPHRVVLLDEIEKSHRDVHQLLLQVFDEGRLTDGRGRTVDFRHSVVIMTSNLGADRMQNSNCASADDAAILADARAAFPVELWNRIEAPLVLRPLKRTEMQAICHRLAQHSSERLFRDRGIRYSVDDATCAHLVKLAGDDPALGARPLRHLLSREVEGRIAEAVLRGHVRAGQQLAITVIRGELSMRLNR